MYNWSTDEKSFKDNPKKHDIWRLEQMINFGLGDEKLNAKLLKKYLPELNIDKWRKEYLNIILNENKNLK